MVNRRWEPLLDERKSILFVVGSARSGTTFLNNLLDRWFDYGMGPEGSFVAQFAKKIGRYGDLRNQGNVTRLIEDISECDMLRIARHRYSKDARFDASAELIRERLLESSYAGVVYAVFQCVSDLQGRRHVGNKHADYWKHLSLLSQLFPVQAKYIFIVRDGRDVALSTMAIRQWGEESIYMNARRWVQSLEALERFRSTLAPGRLLVLRYEDLLRQPRCAMEELRNFLGHQLRPDAFEGAIASIEQNPKRSNYFKWHGRMDAKQLRQFESVAGTWLTKYGYDRRIDTPKLYWHEPLRFSALEYFRLARLNARHYLRRWGSSA